MLDLFLSIDPGKDKSGLAVMDSMGMVLEKEVVLTPFMNNEIINLFKKYNFKKIIIGDTKNGKRLEKEIKHLNASFNTILSDEHGSTLKARSLFWKENKPRGIWRFIPESLRLPYKPYDDLAAVVIGKRYLEAMDKGKL